MITWRVIPCHINLGPRISLSQFLIKNYLVQDVIIQNN
jgi:hypothetical protein